MEDFTSNSSRPTSRSVESIIQEGYSLNLGNHLSAGFRRFGQESGIYVLFALVYIIISMAVQSLPYVGLLGGLLLSPPLLAGFIYYARLQRNNEYREFAAFFNGFRGAEWPSFVIQNILTLIFSFLIVVVVVIPFFLAPLQHFFLESLPQLAEKSQDMSDQEAIEYFSQLFPPAVVQSILLAVFIGVSVLTLFCLAPFFIVYRNYNAFEALNASRKIVLKRYPTFLLLNLVLWFELVIGMMLCCIGYLAALPIFYLSLASAYEEITGD